MLPLYLASGIFIPAADIPGGLRRTAELFPVERLADTVHMRSAARSHGATWASSASGQRSVS